MIGLTMRAISLFALLAAVATNAAEAAKAAAPIAPDLACSVDSQCEEEFVCHKGRCTKFFDGTPCSTDKLGACPAFHTCVNKKCVIGLAGAPCTQFNGTSGAANTNIDCYPGFKCDAATKKCRPGGGSCTNSFECPLGQTCDRGSPGFSFEEPPFQNVVGNCINGVKGSSSCLIDRECEGDQLCLLQPYPPQTEGIPITGVCSARFNYSKSIRPQGFGPCFDKTDCGDEAQFICEQGRCQPLNLGRPFCLEGFFCGDFLQCYETCEYADNGGLCDSRLLETRQKVGCIPGLTCNPLEKPDASRPWFRGRCAASPPSKICEKGVECAKVCGAGGTCAESPEGRECISDLFCPPTARCLRSSALCTFDVANKPDTDFFPKQNLPKVTCDTEFECKIAGLGETCINGVCMPAKLGKNCLDGVCGEGTICSNGFCKERVVGDVCEKNRDCYDGLQCINKKCSANTIGRDCSTIRDCQVGTFCTVERRALVGFEAFQPVIDVTAKCRRGISGARCALDLNCEGDGRCVNRKCVLPETNCKPFEKKVVKLSTRRLQRGKAMVKRGQAYIKSGRVQEGRILVRMGKMRIERVAYMKQGFTLILCGQDLI